jgi:hypothetical protein
MRSRIRDPESFDPGSRMENFGSGINIPDPQQWFTTIFSIKRGHGNTVLEIEKRSALTYAIDALLSELASWQRKVPDVGGSQAFDQIFLEKGENLFQTLI